MPSLSGAALENFVPPGREASGAEQALAVEDHAAADTYSRRNKEWAKTIPNYNSDSVRGGYAVNSHPAVLNGFIDLVREEQQRSCTKDEKAGPPRTSVREKLKKEPPAVNRSTVPKKGEPER